jgi:protein phosphatase
MALEAGTRDNVTAVVCDIDAEDASSSTRLPLFERATFYGAAAERFSEDVDTA